MSAPLPGTLGDERSMSEDQDGWWDILGHASAPALSHIIRLHRLSVPPAPPTSPSSSEDEADSHMAVDDLEPGVGHLGRTTSLVSGNPLTGSQRPRDVHALATNRVAGGPSGLLHDMNPSTTHWSSRHMDEDSPPITLAYIVCHDEGLSSLRPHQILRALFAHMHLALSDVDASWWYGTNGDGSVVIEGLLAVRFHTEDGLALFLDEMVDICPQTGLEVLPVQEL